MRIDEKTADKLLFYFYKYENEFITYKTKADHAKRIIRAQRLLQNANVNNHLNLKSIKEDIYHVLKTYKAEIDITEFSEDLLTAAGLEFEFKELIENRQTIENIFKNDKINLN